MSAMDVQTPPRPRGRPRSLHADEAITDAVLELLAEGTTVEALSMEAVAARAGVGKATIYRRWPHKNALIFDAVASVKQPLPDLPGRSVREDLILLVRAAGKVRDSRAGRIMPCLIPELLRPGTLRDQYMQIMDQRREATRAVIRRGIATGEFRPDTEVELTAALLIGPSIMAMVSPWLRLGNENLAERVVDTLLRGVSRPATGGPGTGAAGAPLSEAPLSEDEPAEDEPSAAGRSTSEHPERLAT